ncbi:MAG: hypothetical protein ACYCOU_05055 [Sulfobacillus sp.]
MKKSILAIAFFCLFATIGAFAQSSGTTPPPPPVCGQSNAGALYTDTGTSPATIYTCSYYNLTWNWVVNPSYGGFIYYPTLPATCAGSMPVFLAGWPNTQMYLCENGVPTPQSNASAVLFNPTVSQTIAQPTSTSFNINAFQVYGPSPFIGFAATAGATNTAGITCASGVCDFGNGTPGDATGTIFAAIANGTYYPLQDTGGDICVKMVAAIAAMPATGGVLNVEGLSGASPASCSVNPFAGVTKPLSILLGPGKINTTAQWYANSSFFHLQGSGMGNTQLIYTGTTALKDPGAVNPGGVLELDSATPATVYNYGDSVSDMSIVGNANSPYAMLVDGTHHSQFHNLSLWGSATCDYESKFAVVDDLDNIHSSSGDASFFGFPGTASPNGMCLDGEDGNHETTAATVTTPISEGHPLCGIEISNASQMMFNAGTSEENSTSGNTSSANLCNGGYHVTLNGLDMEAAGEQDILDNGKDNQYNNVLGSLASTFKGANADVNGGQIEGITIASTAVNTRIKKTRIAVPPIDDGFNTKFSQLYSESSCGANCYTGIPWSFRDPIIGALSLTSYPLPQEDMVRGVYVFLSTPATQIDNTVLVSGHPWTVKMIGDWSTNLQFNTNALAPTYYVTSAQPTVALPGGAVITFSLNSFFQLQATCTTGCGTSIVGGAAFFTGTFFITQSQNSIAALYDIQTPTGIKTAVINATASVTSPVVTATTSITTPTVNATTVQTTQLATPAAPAGTISTTGGTLAAGTYTVEIAAVDGLGNTTPVGASTAFTTTGTTSSVALTWAGVANASSYQVWLTTGQYFTSSTPSFTLTTATGTAGAPPTVNNTGGATIVGPLTASKLTVTSGSGFGVTTPIVTGNDGVTFTADAGAGTSPTIACATGHVCNATSGTIAITTGTTPTAAAGVVTGTFSTALTNIPSCVVSGGNSATALLNPYISGETTGVFVVYFAGTQAASTAYQVKYACGD